MLLLKGDIFKDYNAENFKNLILKMQVVSEKKISESGRKYSSTLHKLFIFGGPCWLRLPLQCQCSTLLLS